MTSKLANAGGRLLRERMAMYRRAIQGVAAYGFRHFLFLGGLAAMAYGFSGVMKLLGHSSPTMTMRYLKIALPDLQREFLLARSQPRHLAPPPRTPASINPGRADMPTLIHSLLVAQHVLEMFRRRLPEGTTRRGLARLANRLTKILSAARKLDSPVK